MPLAGAVDGSGEAGPGPEAEEADDDDDDAVSELALLLHHPAGASAQEGDDDSESDDEDENDDDDEDAAYPRYQEAQLTCRCNVDVADTAPVWWNANMARRLQARSAALLGRCAACEGTAR